MRTMATKKPKKLAGPTPWESVNRDLKASRAAHEAAGIHRPLAKVEIREYIKEAVERMGPRLGDLLERVARKNPIDAIKLVADLTEYVSPKLSRAEHKVTHVDDPLEERRMLEEALAAQGVDIAALRRQTKH